jgi:hypothetical protein
MTEGKVVVGATDGEAGVDVDMPGLGSDDSSGSDEADGRTLAVAVGDLAAALGTDVLGTGPVCGLQARTSTAVTMAPAATRPLSERPHIARPLMGVTGNADVRVQPVCPRRTLAR